MLLRETRISFGGLYERFSMVLKPPLLGRSSHEAQPLKEKNYKSNYHALINYLQFITIESYLCHPTEITCKFEVQMSTLDHVDELFLTKYMDYPAFLDPMPPIIFHKVLVFQSTIHRSNNKSTLDCCLLDIQHYCGKDLN